MNLQQRPTQATADRGKGEMLAAKIIRVATVAPLMAAALTTILCFSSLHAYENMLHYVMSLVFLTVFPLLSYPLSALIFGRDPELRRSKERKLAIIFSVAGYLGGVLFCLLTHCTMVERVIYFTYLLSGVLTAVFSFVFHVKSSGHACGVAGPIAVLIYYVSPLYLFSLVLLASVFWSSLKLRRHSLVQLFLGSLVPVLSLFLSALLCARLPL